MGDKKRVFEEMGVLNREHLQLISEKRGLSLAIRLVSGIPLPSYGFADALKYLSNDAYWTPGNLSALPCPTTEVCCT